MWKVCDGFASYKKVLVSSDIIRAVLATAPVLDIFFLGLIFTLAKILYYYCIVSLAYLISPN
jgi:hypothetical protein